MSSLPFNKLCEIEDFSHPDLLPTILDVCAHKLPHYSADFPRGNEHRKDWEVAMAARSLRACGALHPDAVILGVAAGTEDTLFYLTRFARQVFATDRYFGAGEWQTLAPLAMLVEPGVVSPYEYDPNRLVVQHMDGRSLRYPDNFFDGIFSSGSIEHFNEFTDVANAAYEMGRVLKPGGVLTLSTEMQLSGPPGGIGWPGLTLLFSRENLQRYIIDASGLELVDDLQVDVSPATLETQRHLTQAIIDHDVRVKALGGTDPFADHSSWDFPHLVLLQGGYVFTSVQLTLRKTESYPSARNEWARPTTDTLADISRYNRSLLTRRGAGAPAEEPAAVAPEAAGDPLAGTWEEIEAANRGRGRLLARHEHTVAVAAAEAQGRREEIDHHLAELDRTSREGTAHIDRLLAEITGHLSAAAELAPEGAGTRDDEMAVHPVVIAEGLRFDVAIDTAMDDPVAAVLKRGAVFDPTLVSLMLQLVGPGDRVVDLGAHLGTFALAAAAAGCHVLAIEASPRNAELLHASAAANGFFDLRVIHAVAGDEPVTVRFSANGPWGHVASEVTNLPSVEVPAVTLDELLAEMGWSPIAFVKLDVEGSEIRVIRSMRKLLEGPDAPPLLFESNGYTLDFFGLTPNELLGALEELGYTNHMIEPGRLVPISAADLQPQTMLDCLAFKQPPAGLSGWRVEPPMTVQEQVERIQADCRHFNVNHRRYMAAYLSHAKPALLAEPGVVEILDELARDTDDATRAALAWKATRESPVLQ